MPAKISITTRVQSLERLVGRLLTQAKFKEDLVDLTDLSVDELALVHSELQSQNTTSAQELEEFLQSSNIKNAKNRADTIYGLAAITFESQLEPSEAFEQFGNALQSAEIDAELRSKILTVYKLLCLENDSLQYNEKSEQVGASTGDVLENIEFIPQIRPVFDNSGHIRELIPHCTMVIHYQDSQPRRLELAVTADQVKVIQSLLDIAIKECVIVERMADSRKDSQNR